LNFRDAASFDRASRQNNAASRSRFATTNRPEAVLPEGVIMPRNEALIQLHKTLVGRRGELRKRLGMELDDPSLGKGMQPGGDTADAAFDASGEEIASQLAELESKELAQVERALRRLKQGVYGQCESCNLRIPVARLNALPYSTMCIKCQREMETDSGWMAARGEADWARMADHANPMEDRDFRIADLEIDMSK